jgi:hypothetical protein
MNWGHLLVRRLRVVQQRRASSLVSIRIRVTTKALLKRLSAEARILSNWLTSERTEQDHHSIVKAFSTFYLSLSIKAQFAT